MKKLLSLALVLTMLFTIISVPSASAATEEVVLSQAAFQIGQGLSKMTATGPDANTSNKGAVVGFHTKESLEVNGATYSSKPTGSITTTTDAKATHSGIESIGENIPIVKMTQSMNTSIIRFWMTDGALDIATGDVLHVEFKIFGTDMHAAPSAGGAAVAANTKFTWYPGYVKDTGGTRVRFGTASKTSFTGGQWEDVSFDVTITDSNLATYQAIYGICGEGFAVKAESGFQDKVYPATMYFTAPKVSKKVTIPTNKVTVTKLGEGTVTGDGEVATGSTATLTATPDEGYHFAGWYEKTAAKADANCYSKNSTYSFTVSEDKNIVAVFEKDAVNNWIELTGSEFEGSAPANTNLWGKDASWKNVDHLESVTTYNDAGIEAPDTSCGTGVLKIDMTNKDTSVYGMVEGRIGYYPGYEVRFEEGHKYRVSFWIYAVSTHKGAEKGESIPFSWGPMKQDANSLHNDTLEIGKWVKKSYEFIADSTWVNVYTALKLYPAGFKTIGEYTEEYDSLKLAYVDSVKFEGLDGFTVSAEATNGVVYGTGEYVKGERVTLNAGPDAGYKFEGYYTKDTGTLITKEPSHTFTVEGDTTVVAKFVKRDAAVYERNVLYHYGNETGDVGKYNSWFYYDKDNDKILETTTQDQDSTTTYNKVVNYADAAEYGVFVPNDDPTFGDKLYMQKNTEKKLHGNVVGRFRGWENGKEINNATITEATEASGRYVDGKKYRLTWWVYPVSMQLENGETTQPATTTITICHDDGQNTGVSTKETVNIGEWNLIDWVFTANDKMELYAPGIRYDWAKTVNAETGLSTVVNWAYYDNIQVSEINEWSFGDTAKPSNAWYNYSDQKDVRNGKNNNINASSVVTYAEAKIDKAPDAVGDSLVKMDYSKPSFTEASFNTNKTAGVITGDYADMSYAEAYAYLTRLSNWGGDCALRFNNIADAGTLTIGNTYKISVKVYIAEKKDIETGADVETDTNVKIIGCHDGSTPLGDGQTLTKSVPFGQWTEVSYTFKATKEGEAYAPSLRVDVGAAKNPVEIPTVFYIDDVKVERVYVDDINLVIEKENDTTVTATATLYDIKSATATSLEAVVLIAAYDVDGKLISISTSTERKVALNNSISAKYTIVDNATKYVAFLWDNLINIRPYVKPATYPVVTE